MTDSYNELLGQQVDQYHILQHIARGGMADVYLAEDVDLQRKVALKVMLDTLAAADPQFVERFRREAQMVAKLDHPNIVQVYTVGQTPAGQPYIAMQYVKGGSLRDKLKELAEREKLLTTEQALNIARQIALALGAAHQAGIVHRDMKPANVLVRPDGTPVLVDLGIAAVRGGAKLTQTGSIIGTPAYMSPEQLRGEVLDHRSDVYSAGVMLYHMLTGQAPFGGSSSDVVAVIYSHLEKMPEPPSTINPEVPPLLDAVVMRAMAKDPDERYDNIGDMAREAKAAVGLSVSTTSYPAVAPTLAQRRAHISSFKSFAGQSRNRLWGYLFVLVAIAIIGGALIALSNIEAPIPEESSVAMALSLMSLVPKIASITPAKFVKCAILPRTTASIFAFMIARPMSITSSPRLNAPVPMVLLA